MCSKCGFINQKLTLKDRTFVCPRCNHKQNRDGQAAKNIKTFGLKDILNQTTHGKRESDEQGGYQLWQQNEINFLFTCETVADELLNNSNNFL